MAVLKTSNYYLNVSSIYCTGSYTHKTLKMIYCNDHLLKKCLFSGISDWLKMYIMSSLTNNKVGEEGYTSLKSNISNI